MGYSLGVQKGSWVFISLMLVLAIRGQFVQHKSDEVVMLEKSERGCAGLGT